MMRDAFGEPARVDKDQCRAVRKDQFRNPIVDLRPHLVAGDRSEFVLWNLDLEIQLAAVTLIDDLKRLIRRYEFRHFSDRTYCGR